jgi:hypothetical protein
MSNNENTKSTAAACPPESALLYAVHHGKCLTTYNRNECGVLWEKLWKWTENDGYQSKVCCSGDFSGWHSYENMNQFLSCLKNEIDKFYFKGI